MAIDSFRASAVQTCLRKDRFPFTTPQQGVKKWPLPAVPGASFVPNGLRGRFSCHLCCPLAQHTAQWRRGERIFLSFVLVTLMQCLLLELTALHPIVSLVVLSGCFAGLLRVLPAAIGGMPLCSQRHER